MRPSRDTWLELCRLIIDWPVAAVGEVPVAQIDAALTRWPFELRHLYSDGVNEAGPLNRLARWVSVAGRSEVANQHLARIAASADLVKLKRLTISHSEIDVNGLNVLARSTVLCSLRELELIGLCIRVDELAKLAGSSLLSQLSTLRIVGCKLDGSKLVEWLSSARLDRLETLDLRRNLLHDADAEGLSRWSRFPALRALDVSHNPLSAAGRAELRYRWNCEEGLAS